MFPQPQKRTVRQVQAQVLDLNGNPISHSSPAPKMVRTATGELVYSNTPLHRTNNQRLPHECGIKRRGAVRRAFPATPVKAKPETPFPLLEGEKHGDVRRLRREPFSYEYLNGSEDVKRMRSIHGVIESADDSPHSPNGETQEKGADLPYHLPGEKIPRKPLPTPVASTFKKRPPSLLPTSRISSLKSSPTAHDFAAAEAAFHSTLERSKRAMGKFAEVADERPSSVLSGSTASLPIPSEVSSVVSTEGDEEDGIDMDAIWEEVGREMGSARNGYF
ncbi:hypothetical protein DM02DRAFT_705881 [Periconia macrospinosa]|uniref:Uncharacterized protein n=1 Tax=Periconia macrospinosa TaxID=97972 RepID=A0A2V1E9S1_9PLEO|nr:hypothetical protein DM02DRAFT_705881 [Periconia macrospinosa]